MWTLVWPASFLRTIRKFLRKHPDLNKQFEDIMCQLERDPFTPRLRLHPLSGRFEGKHAVSLTYDYRVVLILKITEREIVLLDIGSHDEVYR